MDKKIQKLILVKCADMRAKLDALIIDRTRIDEEIEVAQVIYASLLQSMGKDNAWVEKILHK